MSSSLVDELTGWPLVRMPIEELGRASFRPFECVRHAPDSGWCLSVACTARREPIGLVFEWAVGPGGVVMVADPFSMLSNVLVFDGPAVLLMPECHGLFLRAIHETGWQRFVRDCAGGPENGARLH